MDLRNTCFKLFNNVFIIVFGCIFTLSILDPYEYGLGYDIKPSVLICYLILLSILFMSIRYQIDKIIHEKILWIIVVVSSVIIIGLQLIFIKEFKVISYYDLNNLYAEASRLFNEKGMITNLDYFGQYPYQLPAMLVIYIIFHIGNLLNIQDLKLLLSIFNMIAIDLGFIILLAYVYKKYDLKRMAMLLILILCFPPLYTYVPYFYTDTISMIFPVILCIFYMLYLNSYKKKKKFIYLTLIGLTTLIGYKFRATVLIITIAIGIHVFFVTGKKNLIAYLVAIVSICGTGSLIYKDIEKGFLGDNYKDRAFPMTHFIMMGSTGEGGYSQEDVNLTNSFITKEEKIQNNIKEIIIRFKENGVSGNLELVKNKIRRVWGHGTYGYSHYLKRVENYGTLYSYVMGDKNIGFLYYNHIYNSLLIFLIVLGSLGISSRFNNEKMIFLNNIILFGWFLFYILWESHPRYTLMITPILVVNSFFGLEYLYDSTIKVLRIRRISIIEGNMNNISISFIRIKKIMNKGILLFSTILVLIIGAFNYDRNVIINSSDIKFIINQDAQRGKNPIEELVVGKKAIQTFKTDKPFNNIELSFYTYNRKNTSHYTIQLIDVENKILIEEWNFNANDIDNQKFKKFTLDTVVPNKINEYAIVITSKDAKKDNAILPETYYYADYDIMPNGELYINDEVTNADLKFRIYNEENKKLMSSSNYIVSVLLISVLQYMILRKVLKLFEKI